METQSAPQSKEVQDVKMEQDQPELKMEKPALIQPVQPTPSGVMTVPKMKLSPVKNVKKQLKHELGYDSDLIIDDEDEQRLDAMTELQREQEINERKQRREILMQRYELVKKQHEAARRASEKKQSSKEEGQCSDQSMDSDNSSSSSSSSSDSSEASVSKRETKKKKAKEEYRSSLSSFGLEEDKNAVTLTDIQTIQLLRKDLNEHLQQPFFPELVKGSFVRVVYNQNTYRMCKVIGVSQSPASYTFVAGGQKSAGKVQTRMELVCQFGKLQKRMQLSQISNSELTFGEFNSYRKACSDQKVELVSKIYCKKVKLHQKKLQCGRVDSHQIAEMVAKRLELKVREGQFNQISNIPYEISRLNTEADSLRQNILTCSKNPKYMDKPLEQALQMRLKRTIWLLIELNKHREGQQSGLATPAKNTEIVPSADELAGQDKLEIEVLGKELLRWQKRQIANMDRQRVEHANLVGALKLEHEKQIYLRNCESLQCSKLDERLKSDGVAKTTGLNISCQTEEEASKDWDSWKYKEQMHGPLLTSSSKPNADYVKWREEWEYCQDEAAATVKKEQEFKVLTFDEYFESRQ